MPRLLLLPLIVLCAALAGPSLAADGATDLAEGLAAWQRGDHLEAAGLLTRALGDDALGRRDRARALAGRGSAHTVTGDYAAALEDFDAALVLEPESLFARNNRGLLLYGLGLNAQAVGDFDAALALDPDNRSILLNRAFALRTLDRTAEALADFEAARALAPLDGAAGLARAVALYRLERYGEAIAAFTALLDGEPENARAWNGLSYARLRGGDPAAALADNDRYLALAPGDPDPWDSRGEILMALGRQEDAIQAWRRALEIDSAYTPTRRNLETVGVARRLPPPRESGR